MKLYISWLPQFSEDSAAVKIITDSAAIDGVEMYNAQPVLLAAKKAGLRVSVHNPGRTFGVGLQEAQFENAFPKIQEICSLSDAPIVGIHTMGDPPVVYPAEEATRQCIASLRLACSQLSQTVAFETTCYGYPNRPRFCVEPAFIARLLQETNAGFLFDTSHIFVSTANMAQDSGRPQEEIIEEIIAACAGRVVQIHFNVPAYADGKWRDVHGICQPGAAMSERMLALTRRLLAENPVQVITLEMDTHTDAVSHARIMVTQAQLLVKALGLAPLCDQ